MRKIQLHTVLLFGFFLINTLAIADVIYCPYQVECWGKFGKGCSFKDDSEWGHESGGLLPNKDFTVSGNSKDGNPAHYYFNRATNIGTTTPNTYVCHYANGAHNDNLQLTIKYPVRADIEHSYNWQNPAKGEYNCISLGGGPRAGHHCPLVVK